MKSYNEGKTLKSLITGIISLLIITNAILFYLYLSSQSEKTSAQSIALIQAKELDTLSEKLDKQNTAIIKINSTVSTLTVENQVYTSLLSSYGTQLDNLMTENARQAKEQSNLTPILGVPTRNGTIIVRRVQFMEIDQTYSPISIGTSPLFDNSSRGLTLSLPPDSFIVNKTWSSVDNYLDHTVGLYTWLRSGEIVSFDLSATKEIEFSLGLRDGGSFVSVDGVSSYGQTIRVPITGVYVFDFAVPNDVHASEYASVSFKCFEVTIS
jgi:hypothetical protein